MPRLSRAQPDEIVFDAWTSISFKHVMGNKRSPGWSWMAPTWVGEHARRLQAYKVLQSYLDNSSRFFLNTLDQEKIEQRREYGDAELVVSTVLEALLGDDYKLTVDGAEVDPDVPLDPKNPEAAPTTDTGARPRELQEYLVDWEEAEKFGQHLQEVEHDVVGLGDGVYVVWWSNAKSRPRIQSYDPGFYFPVLDENDRADQDFPRTVHIAWEIPDPDPTKIRVRRITYRMGAIQPQADFDGLPQYDPVTGVPVLRPGDSLDVNGQIMRQLPWNEEPVAETCYLTDAVWILENMHTSVEDFSTGRAIYEVNEEGQLLRDLDLSIDFIPVIHVPNTVALRNHYGRSSLATVLQIIDDLAGADTDLQAASATTGSPPIALSNATLDTEDGRLKTYGPGTVFETGDGKMEVLDTSKSLDAIIKYADALLSRLAVNAKVPESVLGRVKPSEVPSGIALALSFGPLEQMIRKMRDIRNEKYPLLLKFVLRLAVLGGEIPAGELPPARLRFGSYLPSDKGTAVQHVVSLLPAGALSLQTALQVLIEAGFPIEDAGIELARIRQETAEKQAAALEKVEAEAKIAIANQPPGPNPQQKSSPVARGEA